jgi:hypothetical protein
MGEQDITCGAFHFSWRICAARVQLLLDASLAIIPGECEHPADPQHSLVHVSAITNTTDLKAYIMETKVIDITYYSCGYPDCGHKGRFDTRRQATSRIRCIHLKEKAFKCTTWYAYRL